MSPTHRTGRSTKCFTRDATLSVDGSNPSPLQDSEKPVYFLVPGWARVAIFALLAFLAPLSVAWSDDLVGDAILLQGLDKVTARISEIRVPVGETVRFGTLEIVAHKCLKRPPEETPESFALVEIREVRAGEVPRELFRGWMLASSPALSALEHPVYDVWVKDCLNAKSVSSNGPR